MAAPAAPRVTDHALLRFLGRSGLDVEAVREAIATSLTRAHGAAVALGNGDHLIIVDGLRFVVRQGVVTTVLHRGGKADHAHSLEPRQSR
ncbi:MAG: hypothetical protein V4659_00560 [Pseudomonadota bacterium]